MIIGSYFQQEVKPLLSDCIFLSLPFSPFPCEMCSANIFIAETILLYFSDSELAALASSLAVSIVNTLHILNSIYLVYIIDIVSRRLPFRM